MMLQCDEVHFYPFVVLQLMYITFKHHGTRVFLIMWI